MAPRRLKSMNAGEHWTGVATIDKRTQRLGGI